MRQRFAVLGAVCFILLSAVAAAAAPLWIERKFIPDPSLIDPRFKVSSDTKAVELDHSAWDALLEAYVVQGADGINRVRYAAISSGDGRAALASYIGALEQVDTSRLTKQQQLAYWINLYNAATLRLVAQNYPLTSIRKIKVDGEGPWDHGVVSVQGQSLTLGEIEHHIVRALFPDPRIHYALNCASIGCPNLALKAYTAQDLDAMLTRAAVEYINHPRGLRVRGHKIDVSRIYGWYREDFGEDEAAVLAHLKAYKTGDQVSVLAKASRISRYDYDWALNDAAPAESD